MHIVLFNPEIPPNTGNIARLCAATKTDLHLIKPLGFSLEDKYLKRAGLDYWQHVNLHIWSDINDYMENVGHNYRLIMTSARQGDAVHQFNFTEQDALFFGPETRGLPAEIVDLSPHRVRIPTFDTVRSLNLSTSAGIVLYQALAKTGTLNNW